MFFLLSKLLDFLLLPALWLLGLLLAALLTRRPARRRTLLLAALLLLVIGTNNALVNEALLAWELPPVRLAQLRPRSDAGVLLTGIGDGRKSPHDRVYLGRGADRLTNALWLYRAGRIRRIIISGGSGLLEGARGRTEARELYVLLRLAHVPARAILLEERSRNTRENALYTKELLARHPDIKSLVLITSAFHQRRALGCFRRAGLQPTPFPAGFVTTDRRLSPDYWLVPDADALSRWSLLLHEISGYVVYRVLGYA
ncbi:YdcF family protein [Hymenobacter edaphi]|uniref:YdcF family protein n=1 Tax=Hymenobacter edaphi TaxID=2211146 RepID=A0A328BRQ3_9BACT|nr:YdcF family protein [Hymenobacter edaphi]RAK69733.1 YdcF family protein [Hymenobacter edaphi]